MDEEDLSESDGSQAEEEVILDIFWLEGVDADSDTLPSTTIEMRNDAGTVRSLQVIGVLEARYHDGDSERAGQRNGLSRP